LKINFNSQTQTHIQWDNGSWFLLKKWIEECCEFLLASLQPSPHHYVCPEGRYDDIDSFELIIF
jgi:hypothetical protein